MARLPASSEIAFSFASPRPRRPAGAPPSLAERAAAAGEPWLSYFEPAALEALLRRTGFSAVDFLTPAQAQARYYTGRTDGLMAPERISIGSARV